MKKSIQEFLQKLDQESKVLRTKLTKLNSLFESQNMHLLSVMEQKINSIHFFWVNNAFGNFQLKQNFYLNNPLFKKDVAIERVQLNNC
ncbi:MAG: hypothetical protein RLZZ546_1181 [Bacteroidota bacterium]|jgi:uncharacterized protein YvpB